MMKCPRCNGDGSVPYHIADDLFDETNCPLCGGSGEVMTEQEYIQTCNTEQLAEFLFRIAYMCSYCGDEAHSSQEKMQQCHFGKCGCRRKDWEMWLKQPHERR